MTQRFTLAGALAIATVLVARFSPSTAADVRAGQGLSASRGFEGVVRKAFREQATLLARQEHCSVDPDRLRAIGRGVGQQVRVYKGEAEAALFTVSEAREEEPESVVRMGQAGRERLGTPQESSVRVLAMVPHPSL